MGKFGDSQIGFRNGNWKLTHEGLPALIFGQGGLNDISVDAGRRRISMPKGNDSFTVPSGIPVNFIDSAPVDSRIVDRYFSSVYNGIREQLGSRENKVMTEANDLLHELQQNGDNQGENKIQILEQSASSVCDGLRACASTENEIMWFLVSNIKALTHYLSPHSGQPGKFAELPDLLVWLLLTFLSECSMMRVFSRLLVISMSELLSPFCYGGAVSTVSYWLMSNLLRLLPEYCRKNKSDF